MPTHAGSRSKRPTKSDADGPGRCKQAGRPRPNSENAAQYWGLRSVEQALAEGTLTTHERLGHVMLGVLTPGADGSTSAASQGISDLALFILVLIFMTILGGVLAFDVRGFATRQRKNNTGFTPWGKALHTSQWPNPARIVGWTFFLLGSFMLLLFISAGIATLAG